jgi:hypothetical protein
MLTLFAATLILTASAPPATDLDPAHTYVVVAGVLQWQHAGLTGWPTKHRKDEELCDVGNAHEREAHAAHHEGLAEAIKEASEYVHEKIESGEKKG